jgi:hypothetical protein
MKHPAMQAWASYRRVSERRRLRSFATDCLPERRAYPGTNIQPAIDPNEKSAVLQNSLWHFANLWEAHPMLGILLGSILHHVLSKRQARAK